MRYRALVSFEVPGKPHPLVRARHTVDEATGKHRTYDTSENVAAKEAIQLLSRWKGTPFAGPVRVILRFYYQRANPTADVDNLAKTVFDALNKHVWKDDRQVMELYVAKFGSQGRDYTKILIEEILSDT